ncbi:CsbD family protein [Aspergillus clavatus NRRL 1]|uniref:Mismatched base pair and cruciform DNA recognition protein, putative n=1 Tax=Aspergillus clavatus (strain ATCC 1007 / CBS 513.65 / DSM 816 / NCTC 3887 / NRRL 1 / QM 1276 / 107) TaxID=344612 RepID=A1CLC9_ASPCL|nr:mismatched base pair and cruciform DNA recognition protein, putative [Aspergillus clavatus NRRL 1]EAW09953.1 mismatched base pair and cruciform DNA recognition protein, putative [Aspergillus clavatus NRRL 1]
MSDNNSSTLNSYINQATGLAQRAVGSLTGNASTQAQGEATQNQGQAQHAASHETAKLGPVSADPHTGAAAKDNSNRTAGAWDQTIGSAKESVGNLIGNENLRREGQEQNASGKAQEAKGQLQDWGEGVSDRAKGAFGSAGAALKGDRTEEEKWRDVHDEGKVRQRGAEADMEKRY